MRLKLLSVGLVQEMTWPAALVTVMLLAVPAAVVVSLNTLTVNVLLHALFLPFSPTLRTRAD